MAGRGMKSLSETLRSLTISSSPAMRTIPLRTIPSRTTVCPRQSRSYGISHRPMIHAKKVQVRSHIGKRSMASETGLPGITTSVDDAIGTPSPYTPVSHVPLTLYDFPSLEPVSVESWSAKHLYLPLRKDLLHLAVVYEGDSTRQGTASSLTRYEVHGSHRKLYRQKGTGRARVGNKQSPLRRGGGKTFGPKPRDFSTRLNRKVYDMAWRTALSYRYRRGELVVTPDGLDLPLPDEFVALSAQGALARELEDGFVRRYVAQVMARLRWGRAHGRALFVTADRRPNLFTALETAGEEGRALELADVDIKDLLEPGRVVVERAVLAEMIRAHSSDLTSRVYINGVKSTVPTGEPVVV